MRVLSSLFELKEDANSFCKRQTLHLTELLFVKMWMSKLAYLADIFCRLNELNISFSEV